MATELIKGKPVADAITAKCSEKAKELREKGIVPCLAILRVGENDADISYERGAMKRCASADVEVRNVILPKDVSQEAFDEALEALNHDDSVHGILMFRPLPKHLNSEKARNMIAPEKDIDGCTDGSLAGVFTNTPKGFAPCTAQAAIEILDYYGIEISGKNVTVLGRSLVVGKPLALLLMNRNATITVCHRKTVDTQSIARKADIVVAAIGEAENITAQYLREGQYVIDVGISWNEAKGKLCGDVLFEEAEPLVKAITPVPGGVGSVTTSVLVSHVIEAACRMNGIR
ncbi:MAG TPA: bifunctional 5,10-methylene-tetrahydrofolate dehydrogenase/5,10-methylene-tetrahydrofolate cyclohydrolase [Erysipelotrichaceae bacterium]|nr:bifunctional 5,10-methylene-tetrahydrofolate dehydrogenase/5,10-methylene-tetrahydrofolate cyclohydrolase [Erysipelotrichaceae bacterium]